MLNNEGVDNISCLHALIYGLYDKMPKTEKMYCC